MANRHARNASLRRFAREFVKEGFSVPELFEKLAVEMELSAAEMQSAEEVQALENDARLLRELERQHRKAFSC